MKTVLVLLAYTFVICCINCNYSTQYLQSEFAEYMKRFCNLPSESQDKFYFCLLDNGLQPAMVLYKNCVQQIKFSPTLRELDEYICYSRTEQEYLKFLNCFIPAAETLNRDNYKLKSIAEQCLTKEENCRGKRGHDVCPEYQL